ncbi:fructosamine kinase PKL/CAK/FruK [Mycena belliarum]|uniref:protein-ribulosamine 3-kinase n=1 Tax=Mycena belliarum TaxID=1033014 RepID=A0AAD6UJE9_9AGAR|nr:fructosamine kinase PKL/CAK/FruK [Mycena belliae]
MSVLSTPSVILEHLRRVEPDAEFLGSLPHLVSSNGKHYYAKTGSGSEAEQFAGEAESLIQMAAAAPGLAPRVIAAGVDGIDGNRPYMISEYKNLASLDDSAARRLGTRLATELHQYSGPQKRFGFGLPTYCGATRLQNGWFDTWDLCFSAMIGDLLSQLEKKGGHASLCTKGQQVRQKAIPKLLGSLAIRPALLHGDLWSGNMGSDTGTGEPVIFDPASYYGHNEADLAIARIFGGIPKTFYEAYHQRFPKAEPVEQYELRGDLYQLFHYLNHTLLFGGHYATSAEKKMDNLLRAAL